MGGDYGPRVVIDGALAAARHLNLGLVLVGRSSAVEAELARHPDLNRLDVAVLEAPDVIDMAEPPAAALRRKPGASVKVAASAVARGEAAGLVSMGHTGASMMAAFGAFGMLPGVERPALATAIPTRTGSAVLLDVGAAVDCRPMHLVQFAVMGAAYARVSLGLERPRVGLLSIGEEETKGSELVREAHQRLKGAPVQFIGNIEARDVYAGQADVIVCDGFTGNIALKTSEGLVDTIEALLADELSRTFSGMVGSLLSRRAFRRFRKRVDYSEYGGAPLLGLARLCIVGHGRSSSKAVRNAVVMAYRFATQHLIDRLEQDLAAASVLHR
jgi:glycerol-3-phosphate acyltransferase PlsX